MDLVAKHSPFHAQVWKDSHSDEECFHYLLKDRKSGMEKLT